MAGEQSSRKRHRFFLENSEEFTLEVEEDDGTTATTTITTTTNTSNSTISINTHPASSNRM